MEMLAELLTRNFLYDLHTMAYVDTHLLLIIVAREMCLSLLFVYKGYQADLETFILFYSAHMC